MRELDVAKLPEFVEEDVRVSEWSTMRVKHCAYSVPSRLIGEWVRVRIFEDRLEVCYADKHRARVRAAARPQSPPHRLPPRDLVAGAQARRLRALRLPRGDVPVARVPWGLRRDPDARIRASKGDLEYLRILHLAASTMEADVEAALGCCSQTAARPITADAVKAMIVAAPTRDRRADARAGAGRPRGVRRAARRGGGRMTAIADAPLAVARACCCARSSCRRSRATPRRSRRRPSARAGPSGTTCTTSPSSRSTSAGAGGSSATSTAVRPAAEKTLATLNRARLPPKVAKMLPTLCEGGFVERGDNLLAFGLPGRGKTHLVCAIGHELIQRGYRVLFTATFALVQRLLAGEARPAARDRSSRSSTASTP